MASGVTVKFEYDKTVAKSVKKQLSKEIVDSVEGSAEMRAEMRKTFQQANRRIQNIENAGLYSPAVAGLGKQDIKGYSKFSVKGFGNSGQDWETLKKEYAKAVSFLQQPTSTASGTRQWQEQIRSQLGLTTEQFEGAVNDLMNGYNSVSGELLGTINYHYLIQDIYDTAMESASNTMEQDAITGAESLERSIEQQANEIAGNSIDLIEQGLEGALKF